MVMTVVPFTLPGIDGAEGAAPAEVLKGSTELRIDTTTGLGCVPFDPMLCGGNVDSGLGLEIGGSDVGADATRIAPIAPGA